ETSLLHRSVHQVLQPSSHHRTCSTRGGRGEENIQHLIRLALDLDQQFLFEFVRSDKWHEPIVPAASVAALYERRCFRQSSMTATAEETSLDLGCRAFGGRCRGWRDAAPDAAFRALSG